MTYEWNEKLIKIHEDNIDADQLKINKLQEQIRDLQFSQQWSTETVKWIRTLDYELDE